MTRSTDPTPTLTLPQFFETVYLPERMICAASKTIEQYRLALKHWQAVHPDLPINAIDARAVAKFQSHLIVGRSSASVNGYTRYLKAILRFAAEEENGLIDKAPKIRMLHERKKTPLALTIEEFEKILNYVKTIDRKIGRYQLSDWWTAVLLTCWESGLRFTALMSIRTIDLLWEDSGFISQADVAKDREADWYPLQQSTLDAIRKIYSSARELLFPRIFALRTLERHIREILDRSGIYAPKGSGMCFHRIRRSKASYTKLHGGNAQEALGHSAPSVTERYYDPRIVSKAKQPPMPMPFENRDKKADDKKEGGHSDE